MMSSFRAGSMISKRLVLNTASRAALSSAAAQQLPKSSAMNIVEAVKERTPLEQARFKQFKEKLGNKVLGEVTVDQALGGARDVPCIIWEPSLLDAQEGIRFRGLTIPELQAALPPADGVKGHEPGPEALLWLLMTGTIPNAAQAASVTRDLHERSDLPAHVEKLIRSFPKTMHPMTQFSMAVLAMQTDSKFAKGYSEGLHKSKYADVVLEDCLNLIARLPRVAALIYAHSYGAGNAEVAAYDKTLDYSKNFNHMLGFKDNKDFDELMRLYLVIHADHEGGNASAHTTHLVGSTLSDPYLSFAAGLNALAGPLHGLANQEVLRWVLNLAKEFESSGRAVNKDTIEQFAWDTLKQGRVIPGYGHAVLRKTDPRYTAQRAFALKYMPEDPLFKIVSTIYEVVPGVLTKQGKTKNPWPNVDSHSGVLLYHYGLRQDSYYTVLFGVSRAFGVLSQLYWSRALGFPLERPKSFTTEAIEKRFGA